MKVKNGDFMKTTKNAIETVKTTNKNNVSRETIKKTVKKVNNIEKVNTNENIKNFANSMIELINTKQYDGTKTQIIKLYNDNNFYTPTQRTDTVNYNDTYLQLNTTDKPRLWFKKSGFQLQFDKFAKRDNKTEIYENIAKKYNFTFTYTPSYANRNQTSTMIKYDLLENIMNDLYNNNIIVNN